MSQQMVQQYGVSALSVLMGQNPGVGQQLLAQAVGVGSQLGMLSFSRTHESEADKIVLIFMSMAGYDPRQSVTFWQRMSANGGQKPPEWLSTHPSDQTRIRDLQKLIPQALKFYKPSAPAPATSIPTGTPAPTSAPSRSRL
jgi:predicted Zn-dependent protease